MKTALSVVEYMAIEAPCILEFDGYIPLNFRTYETPLGASYVRLGNYSTTLLELALAPHSRALRRVTVTSYDVLSDWPEFRVVSESEGLPVLAAMSEPAANRIDLPEDFHVAVKSGEVLVFWGELKECHQSNFAHVHCLVRDGQLRGIRFSGLSDDQDKMFVSHAGGRKKSW
jgi:hypothetical protein